jgi:hypothetical protein
MRRGERAPQVVHGCAADRGEPSVAGPRDRVLAFREERLGLVGVLLGLLGFGVGLVDLAAA